MKFALNSTLDIKSYNIELAFVIKDSIIGPNWTGSVGTPDLVGFQQCFTDPSYTTNLISLDHDVDDLLPLYNYYPFENGIDFDTPPGYTAFRPIYPSPYQVMSSFKKNRVRTYESEFIPLDAFYESVYEIGIKNDRVGPVAMNAIVPSANQHGFKNDLQIELKVMVELEFFTVNQYGENNKSVEIYTYKIPKTNFDTITGDLVPNLAFTNYNIDFPKNLNFVDVSIDGSAIDGCVKIGNSYLCKAREHISLSGIVTTSSGYNVNFIAGEEIVEHPGSLISGEVIRQISPVYNYNHPMPQVKEDEIISFCGDMNNPSAYQANIIGKVMLQEGANGLNEDDSMAETFEPLSIRLFPNPATNSAVVSLSRFVEQVKIEILDLSGRLTNCSIVNNQLNYAIDLNKLESGLYVVKVSSPEGTITKNLIVK